MQCGTWLVIYCLLCSSVSLCLFNCLRVSKIMRKQLQLLLLKFENKSATDHANGVQVMAIDFGPECRSLSRKRGKNHWVCILLLLVCMSFTIIGQPRNSVLIRRV